MILTKLRKHTKDLMNLMIWVMSLNMKLMSLHIKINKLLIYPSCRTNIPQDIESKIIKSHRHVQAGKTK